MNKWEVDEREQWNEKARSQRLCPPLLDKKCIIHYFNQRPMVKGTPLTMVL